MPVRIQRKRTKGWRAPLGAVDVTRGGKFGNPFVVTEKFKPGTKVGGFYVAVPSVEDAVECFRSFLQEYPDFSRDRPSRAARKGPDVLVRTGPALPRRCAPRTGERRFTCKQHPCNHHLISSRPLKGK